MHITAKHFTSVAGLATTLILAASQANAQTAKFTLPFPAHVGKATLPAGDYRLQISGTASPIPAFYLYREGKLVAHAPAFRQLTQYTNGNYLELVDISGSRYVSKFVSNDNAAIYTFVIPSAARHEILADTRASRVSVNRAAN